MKYRFENAECAQIELVAGVERRVVPSPCRNELLPTNTHIFLASFFLDSASCSLFPHGMFVKVRVLKSFSGQPIVDVSLRPSRIEGDLDEEESPQVGETVKGYVITTNKKGCFVRVARHIQGRVILKELCDGFLPQPTTSFPSGRLVAGKIKAVREVAKKQKKAQNLERLEVDLDMRESVLLGDQNKLKFDDVQLQSKYKGTVTRVESFGVFVRLEHSDVSGLVHKSECSDDYVKDLAKMYDPGDLVKVIVIKKDSNDRRLGFSMKPSHFADDEDSDDLASNGESSKESDIEDLMEVDKDEDDDVISESEDSDDEQTNDDHMEDGPKVEINSSLSSRKKTSRVSDHGGSKSLHAASGGPKNAEKKASKALDNMDTDVGFDWDAGATSSKGKKENDEESSDDDNSDSESSVDSDIAQTKSPHKSRKKQAQRRQEEREIARRETALADGTADETPQTAADFDRLLAGNPNSSEIWIRYMAFYLSLADIRSARSVAERAFERIEFRQEEEKLNVWTALLNLENKFGSPESLQATVEKACMQNNPKYVYLRLCEILEKEVEITSTPESLSKADTMFARMCQKFKTKKKVWLAHVKYLLKLARHDEAHELLKRALMSLASYKHAETMSKFAQLEFEFGSPERARTVFDGILSKYPKRLDLFFVYLDKEVKYGTIEVAREALEKKINPPDGKEIRLSDKQMKSLFKKWYRIEEEKGDENTRNHVKETARAYVERSSMK